MFFETEREEFNLTEFVTRYALPCFSMVKKGFYGIDENNTLDREQVFRFEGIHTEIRVYANVLKDSDGCLRHYTDTISIPLTCDIPMRVQLEGQADSANETMREILNKHKFPVNVQLSLQNNPCYSVSSKIDTKRLSGTVCLRLFKKHCLKYVYGNPVSNDRLYGTVVSILLDVSDVKFSLVTGITMDNNGVFKCFEQGISAAVKAYVKFDNRVGNPDIYVAGRAIDKQCSRISTNIAQTDSRYEKPISVRFDKHEGGLRSVVVKLTLSKKQNRDSRHSGSNNSASVHDKSIKHLMPVTSDESDKDIKISDTVKDFKHVYTKVRRPMVLPHKIAFDSYGIEYYPVTQPEETECSRAWQHRPMKPTCTSINHRYEKGNGLDYSYINTLNGACGDNIQFDQTYFQSKNDGKYTYQADVKTLSVRDLGHCMARLNLRRHIPVFEDEEINGSLLMELDEQFLQGALGFSGYEAKILIEFARSGIIPDVK